GFIAGIHRLWQGTMNDFFYVPSSILIGFIAGWLGKRKMHRHAFISTMEATLIAALMECAQMGFILFFSPSFTSGLNLIRFIAFPMILLNSVGTFIFMSILTITFNQ